MGFLYFNSNWLEREQYDLFGIKFKNHPNLCRILTDYGFFFFPFRKSYPLIGYEQIFYNEKTKKLFFVKNNLEKLSYNNFLKFKL